jgi:hypothetical protein
MIVRLEVRGTAAMIGGRNAPEVSITVEHGGAEGGGAEHLVEVETRRVTETATDCAERILDAIRGDRLKQQVLDALERADRNGGDAVRLLEDVAELVDWTPKRDTEAVPDGG